MRDFEFNRLNLPIAGLPKELYGLRILHMADMHLRGVWPKGYDHLLALLKQHPPDLVLNTGDFVESQFDPRPALPILERLLRQLPSRLGIFGITGNHDGDLVGARLKSLGVHFINRRYVKLESSTAAMELIGLPGVRRRDFDPEFLDSIPPKQPAVPRIVLAHFPDQVRFIGSLQADVMLAGHTHGGQICLPRGIPLLTHDDLPKHMSKGTHDVEETKLIVSRGMGTTDWQVRMWCMPEVIELTLQPLSS